MRDGLCFRSQSEKHMIITMTFTWNTYTLYVFKDGFFYCIHFSFLTTKTEVCIRLCDLLSYLTDASFSRLLLSTRSFV